MIGRLELVLVFLSVSRGYEKITKKCVNAKIKTKRIILGNGHANNSNKVTD